MPRGAARPSPPFARNTTFNVIGSGAMSHSRPRGVAIPTREAIDQPEFHRHASGAT